jgi:hypothetical protein
MTWELLFKGGYSCSQRKVQSWFYLSGQILVFFKTFHILHITTLLSIDNILVYYVMLLFGNNLEVSDYTTAVTKQWPVNSNRGSAFSVRCVLRSYKEGKLSELVFLFFLPLPWHVYVYHNYHGMYFVLWHVCTWFGTIKRLTEAQIGT